MNRSLKLLGILLMSSVFIVGCGLKGSKYKVSDKKQYQIEYDYVVDEQVPEYGALDMMLTSVEMATRENNSDNSLKGKEYYDLVFAKMNGTIDSMKREHTKENKKIRIDNVVAVVSEGKKSDAKKLFNEMWDIESEIINKFEKIKNNYNGKAINKEIYRDLKSKVDTYNSKLESFGTMIIGGAIKDIGGAIKDMFN